MKTSSNLSLTGLHGNGECFTIPVLVYPSVEIFFPVYILWGKKLFHPHPRNSRKSGMVIITISSLVVQYTTRFC